MCFFAMHGVLTFVFNGLVPLVEVFLKLNFSNAYYGNRKL